MTTLRDVLSGLTVFDLKPRIQLLKVDRPPTRKADLVDLLEKQLLSDKLKVQWQLLDGLEQQAVAEAIHHYNGCFDRLRFPAKYGAVPKFFGRRDYGSPPDGSRLGLFFYHDEVPEELAARLRTFVPEPEAAKLNTLGDAAPPETWTRRTGKQHQAAMTVRCANMEAAAKQELGAVLRLVDSGRISVGEKTGIAGAASLRQIGETLTGGDFYSKEENSDRKWVSPINVIRAYAWPLLIQSGGLTKKAGKKLELTRKGKKALSEPFEEAIEELFSRWTAKGMLDELRRIDVIKGQTAKGVRLTPPSDRRAMIEAVLSECPVGEWVSIDELFRFMRAEGFIFEVSRNLWKLYIGNSEYGSLGYSGTGGWHILQARYTLAFLFEYVATLGLIDVAYVHPDSARPDFLNQWGTDDLPFLSRYDGLLYIRLNPLGAYCLGFEIHYAPTEDEAPPLFRVRPDLEIELTGEPMPADRIMLEQFAEPIAADTWKITQNKILRAIEESRSIDEFHAFLASKADHALPVEVEQFFDDAKNRSEAMEEIGNARLIRCRTPALAKMIASDPLTQKFCMLAGERELVVPEKLEGKFRQALFKQGFVLPKK